MTDETQYPPEWVLLDSAKRVHRATLQAMEKYPRQMLVMSIGPAPAGHFDGVERDPNFVPYELPAGA